MPQYLDRDSAAGARRQVVRDVEQVDELVREDGEALHVGHVRGEPERGTDRPAGGQADRLDVVVEGHASAELAADERLARDREGDLAGARIAEATGSQRDGAPAGDAVDVALVDDAAVGMEEVEGDRRAATLEVAGAVDRRGRCAVRMPQRPERF